MLYYAAFRTKWGYFGVAGNGAVRRTCLPVPQRRMVESELSKALRPATGNLRLDKTYLRDLQQRIVAYFEGEPVDFTVDPAVSPDDTGVFARQVLLACRAIGFGRTITYAGLAARIGRPGAARAVGRALATNPIPLIIPCHRVLRTDGGLGGFSAPGGTAAKRRLLDHEQSLRLPTS